MRLDRCLGIMLVTAALAAGQQANTLTASMLVDGVNGPPFPIVTTTHSGVPVSVLITGNGGAPYAILQSATGMLQTGAATVFGDKLDLPVSPLPIVVVGGPGYITNFAGQASLFATIPASAVGMTMAHQALIVDGSSPFGFSLTAATGATVVQGPITTLLTLGDEGTHTVSMGALQLPFYGINHTNVFVNANGYMTFGSPTSDFTPSDNEFASGPPRLAGFWTDFNTTPGTVTLTVNATPTPTTPGYIQVTYTNVQGYLVGLLHNVSMLIRSDGLIQISHAQNLNAPAFDQITGIGPGGGLNPQPEKDLSAFLLPNSYAGGVNESFYQWFGLMASMPYYPQADDPYDLFGRILTFVPNGTGGLPGSTLQYLML